MLKSFLILVVIATPLAVAALETTSFSDSYGRSGTSATTIEVIDPVPSITTEEKSFAPKALQDVTRARTASLAAIKTSAPATTASPTRITAPAIKLDAPVQKVGLNAKGEMDVPDGKTNNVGWYKDGTVPGEMGSAVLDAHVFAAFSKLRYLKVGDDLYVRNVAGSTLHFVVRETRVYALADVPAERLFNGTGGRLLNLITCAGKPTADGSTYDHRLIVYAEFVDTV